jgi:nucleoside-triphosphatase
VSKPQARSGDDHRPGRCCNGNVPNNAPRILLTGAPRAGKTTLVRRIVAELAISGIAVGGFITGELREQGRRVGFLAEAIGGGSAILAHVTRNEGPVVGRYHVDVPAFDRVALPALDRAARECDVLVIDEIGLMELYSDAFAQAVQRIFELDVALVATVPAQKHPVTEDLKQRPGVELLTVTRGAHDAMVTRVTAYLLDGLTGAALRTGGPRPER